MRSADSARELMRRQHSHTAVSSTSEPQPAMTATVMVDSPGSGVATNGVPVGAGVGHAARTVPSAHVNAVTVTVGCTLASTVTPGVAAAICCASGELGVVAIVANVWASEVSAVPELEEDDEPVATGSDEITTVR